MGSTSWEIKGPHFTNCNCAWGCPCQFNALPTHGNCRVFGAMRIDAGHFGDLRLDGLHWAWLLSWPGAVHEANGTMQVIVDERGDEQQRAALETIVQGRESDEGANVFQIYASTMSTFLETLVKPIEFECNIDARIAQVTIPGLVESSGEPIRNPVTGDEHRVRVTLPNGMEYTEAEYGSGSTKATGQIALDFSDSYGQFSIYHLTSTGPIRP